MWKILKYNQLSGFCIDLHQESLLLPRPEMCFETECETFASSPPLWLLDNHVLASVGRG